MSVQANTEFDRFVLRRSTALLRTAVLLTGDRGHAEDLLQTALLRLVERWHRVREHPEAYVRRILVNLARDRWRRSRRRAAEHELTDRDHAVAGDPAETVVDRDALRRALAALRGRQREVVVLRLFADLSVAETAAALGTSAGTVKTQTSRAIARLREALGEQITEGRR